MAPSRGVTMPTSTVEASTGTPHAPEHVSTETKAIAAESTALSRARTQLSYLINPSTASKTPGRFRTRALLRSLHYLGVFVFWRAVRWAKYALIGSIAAALGSFALAGSFASGIGFLVAPPGILASIAVGTVWGIGKYGWRRYQRKRGKSDTQGSTEDPRLSPRVSGREPEMMPW